MGIERKFVSFLIPVIDGHIWLGQRNTEPHKGKFGAVGGKSAQRSRGLHDKPHTLATLGGGRKLSVADAIAEEEGREYLGETAVREFCEEAFSDKQYPDGFKSKDITDVYRLGSVDEVFPELPGRTFHAYFFIAKIHRKDFALSPRELQEMVPLEGLAQEQIIPATQLALFELSYRLRAGCYPREADEEIRPYFGLERTLPTFEDLPVRNTNMPGPIIVYNNP